GSSASMMRQRAGEPSLVGGRNDPSAPTFHIHLLPDICSPLYGRDHFGNASKPSRADSLQWPSSTSTARLRVLDLLGTRASVLIPAMYAAITRRRAYRSPLTCRLTSREDASVRLLL